MSRLRALLSPDLPALRTALAGRALIALPLLLGATAGGFLDFHRPGFPLVADAWWYTQIALHGYHAAPIAGALHDVAFWPLWPALLRLSAPLGDAWALGWAGVAVATILGIAAAVAWHRLLRRRGHPELARLAVLLLAVGPACYVLSLPYSEPLFLLLTAVALDAPAGSARRRLAAAAVALTRPTGVLVALALLAEPGAPRRTRLFDALAPLLAFGAHMLLLAHLTGRPDPWALTAAGGWLDATGQERGLLGWLSGPGFLPLELLFWLPGLVALAGLPVLLRRPELRPMGLLSAATLLVVAATGLWSSQPRMALGALPAAAAGMAALPPRARRAALTVGWIVAAACAFAAAANRLDP
jgi:hypothetical protein